MAITGVLHFEAGEPRPPQDVCDLITALGVSLKQCKKSDKVQIASAHYAIAALLWASGLRGGPFPQASAIIESFDELQASGKEMLDGVRDSVKGN